MKVAEDGGGECVMRLQIKICGITRPQDAELAVGFGATHIGCVLVSDSPRRVTIEQAREVVAATGKKAVPVLVFKNASPSVVRDTATEIGVRQVQLHGYGEADAKALEGEGLTVLRVHEVPTGANVLPPIRPEPTPERPALLDVAGGVTNVTFPWEILGPHAPPATFISGNVRPENVCALLTHHPYGIDISSGVEMAPGRKDPDRIELLFDTLREAGVAV